MRGFGHYFCAGLLTVATVSIGNAAHAKDGLAAASGKGIVGTGLLGGEAVMLVEAASGVRQGWAYGVGGGLGAAAGAVGGYFIEQEANPRISLYLLVGGMTLIIPTTVAVLSTTAYKPVNYVEDRPPPDEPTADPAHALPAPPAAAPTTPSTSAPTSKTTVHRGEQLAKGPALPPALVGLTSGTLTLSVPAVEVRHVYTPTEVATLGVKQRTELAIPVFNAVF